MRNTVRGLRTSMTYKQVFGNILVFGLIVSNVKSRSRNLSEKRAIFYKQGQFEQRLTEGRHRKLTESWSQQRQRGRDRRSQNSNGFSREQLGINTVCDSTVHCKGNRTEFNHGNYCSCFCDNACFETFHDCCPDYEMQCGKQNTSITDAKRKPNSKFSCVELGSMYYHDRMVIGLSGVWMIQTCPSTWPSDETKRKCHEAPYNFSHPVEDYLPVVGQNQFTYRNKHCAICHGIKNYTTWNIKVHTYETPVAEYDLDAKFKFIVNADGIIKSVYPMPNQPRRYCAGKRYIDRCVDPRHKSNNECLNGPVEVVVGTFRYYKNRACAICNGDSTATSWISCSNKSIGFEVLDARLTSSGFSDVFDLSNTGVPRTTSIVPKSCSPGTVYDEIQKFCRKAYITSNKDNLSNEFQVFLWLRKASNTYNVSYLQRHFETALKENFDLNSIQISAINFHKEDEEIGYLVVTFRLTLTPYQHFILANQNVTNMNISRRSKKFLKLFKFEGNFEIHFKKNRFPVVKVKVKQLAGFQGRTFKHGEYQLNKTSGTLIVNKTGEHLLLRHFSILQKGGKNITLYRKLVHADCINGSYVPLHPNEYVILSNLSLYHNLTKKTFEFGEYQINEHLNSPSDDHQANLQNRTGQHGHKQTGFPDNVTFAICLPYKATYNATDITNHTSTNYFLQILTMTGFSISITCLLLLVITYALFKELRTLPGLNLMSLSFSILLYQCLWLIGTSYLQKTTWCTVFAILLHYLIFVSFFAMSVISYHSCLVFSKSSPVRRSDDGWRTYVKYSTVVWCCPAIFVVICVALDRTGAFTVNYGTNCWLGTKNSKLYLFLLPIALLLLYSISTFVRTVVRLSALTRQVQQLQILRNRRRQNLLACVKLATLVGFPWIFAFFGVLFPDVVEIEYSFVIFVCLQGFYIAVAFLCNKKVLHLYKNRWRCQEIGATEPGQRKAAFKIKLSA